MSISRRLEAHRQANSSAVTPDTTPDTTPEDEPEDEGAGDGKKKEHKMSDTDTAALADAEAKGFTAGSKATHERYAAVMASEHYAGRETLALKLLGNDKLGADEIVDALSAADTKPEPEANSADPEAAARAEMQAALSQTGNSQIAADGGGANSNKQASSDVWSNVVGKMFPSR